MTVLWVIQINKLCHLKFLSLTSISNPLPYDTSQILFLPSCVPATPSAQAMIISPGFLQWLPWFCIAFFQSIFHRSQRDLLRRSQILSLSKLITLHRIFIASRIKFLYKVLQLGSPTNDSDVISYCSSLSSDLTGLLSVSETFTLSIVMLSVPGALPCCLFCII